MRSSYYLTYSDPYGSYMDSSVTTVLLIYLGIFLVVGIIGLVSYIFKGLGMYRMAKREGMDNPWLAFVPFARTYLQGELCGDIAFKKKSLRNPGIWLIVLPLGGGVLLGILYVVVILVMAGAILAVEGSRNGMGFAVTLMVLLLLLYVLAAVAYQALISVLKALVNYQILRKFTSNSLAIVHAILSNLVPLYESIVLFVYRNKPYNPGMEPYVPEQPENVPPVQPSGDGNGEVNAPTEAPAEACTESEGVQEVVAVQATTERKPYVYSDSKETTVKESPSEESAAEDSVELVSEEPDRYEA